MHCVNLEFINYFSHKDCSRNVDISELSWTFQATMFLLVNSLVDNNFQWGFTFSPHPSIFTFCVCLARLGGANFRLIWQKICHFILNFTIFFTIIMFTCLDLIICRSMV